MINFIRKLFEKMGRAIIRTKDGREAVVQFPDEMSTEEVRERAKQFDFEGKGIQPNPRLASSNVGKVDTANPQGVEVRSLVRETVAKDRSNEIAAASTEQANPKATQQGNKRNSITSLNQALALRESSNNPKAVNQYGYIGKHQFGKALLVDLGYVKPGKTTKDNYNNRKMEWTGKNGIKSTEDFLNNEKIQDVAFNESMQLRKQRLKTFGLLDYVGKKVHGIEITLSGALAAAHLVGEGGLRKFIREGKDVKDGNGTSVKEYLQKFAKADISEIV